MSDKLMLTQKALAEAPNLKSMFEIEAVKYNCIGNLMKTTGLSEEAAAMKYEREKILFMKAITATPALEKCDRFSIYCAGVELFASGSTLADGCSFIIAYGDKAQFQMGYKGRLDQMNVMPGVSFVASPQVVYSDDQFDYELGDNPKVICHKPKAGRGKAKEDLITHVYMVIEEGTHKRVVIMERHEIIAIRDRYSKLFKGWRSKGGRTFAEDGEFKHATGKGQNGDYQIELPFWLTSYDGGKTGVDNPEAFKKTIVTRTYNAMPNKTGRMKAIDKLLETRPDAEDPKDEPNEIINYGINQKVDASSGEITNDVTHTEVKDGDGPKEDDGLGNPSDSF